MTDLFDAPTAGDLARLRGRLAVAAERCGDLDVAYRRLDSPVGTLLLAATPRGLVRVAFATEDADTVLAELVTVSPRVLEAPARLDPYAAALDGYFGGQPLDPGPPVDLVLARGFRRTVLDRLREIPFGATRSYAQVAAATDSPRAVRAVGTACARNPVPLLVPCHRVVRSDGAPGAYRGGEQAKEFLLALERGDVSGVPPSVG